ncbi:MAG: Phospho-2-dehydro-3-deoxyheptonate aldolase [Planctomycetes bacterium]|nr:Phospho-2-dehydro-3-deoxyheptonate aldolase [Planctomycetota bacterium]
MIVLCRPDLTDAQRERILSGVRGLGVTPHVRTEGARTVVEAPASADAACCEIERLAGVDRVFTGDAGAHLATWDGAGGAERTRVRVGTAEFGGRDTVLVAGPCAVEGRDVLLEIAHAVRAAGAHVLRGGAFKPRTSPYSFRGLGPEGLDMLDEARAATGLPFVTEVMDTRDVELVERHADMLQIGSRNMHNFALLSEVGRTRKPVLLKRGMSATIDEWLASAEYVLAGGNTQVVLCERGIRTFEPSSRNTLDLTAVPLVRERTHLPVVVDPSHASGRRSLVAPLARAACAAGADGVMVECHVRPDEARCDAKQAILPEELAEIAGSLRTLDAALRGPARPASAAMNGHAR